MIKKAFCFMVLLPFVVLLTVGAIAVAIALFFIYRIADLFGHPGAEWSA